MDTDHVTLAYTVPAVICDDTECGTAVPVEPGTYEVESIDFGEQMAYLDVPAVTDWYVAVHTDWLDAEAPPMPTKPKAG